MAVINMLPAAIIEAASDPILEVLTCTRTSSESNCMLVDTVNGSVRYSNQGPTVLTGAYLQKDGYNIKAVVAGKYMKGTASRSDNQNITLSEVTCTAGETIYGTANGNVYAVYKVGED